MRRVQPLLAIGIVGTLLLSACQVTFEPLPPPTPDDEVVARDNFDVPVGTYLVQPGRTILVEIAVDTTQPLLYIELESDSNLNLEVLNASRTRLASSSSPSYFAAGGSGLAAAGLSPLAVNADVACRGSCVITKSDRSDTFFARINNTTGRTVEVGLYAYGDIYQDEWEPGNDTRTGATPYTVGGTESGAIETLGDVDFWRAQGNGWVEFTAANAAVRVEVIHYAAGGDNLGTFVDGDLIQVRDGDILEVFAAGGRAAASADSKYTFSANN